MQAVTRLYRDALTLTSIAVLIAMKWSCARDHHSTQSTRFEMRAGSLTRSLVRVTSCEQEFFAIKESESPKLVRARSSQSLRLQQK